MCAKSPCRFVFWCCLVAVAGPRAVAADVLGDLEVHGFATQGYVKTTANSFFGGP